MIGTSKILAGNIYIFFFPISAFTYFELYCLIIFQFKN